MSLYHRTLNIIQEFAGAAAIGALCATSPYALAHLDTECSSASSKPECQKINSDLDNLALGGAAGALAIYALIRPRREREISPS